MPWYPNNTLLVTFMLLSRGSQSLRMNLLDLSRYGLFLKLCLASYSFPLYADESRFGHCLCWYFHRLTSRWWGHLRATNLRWWVAFTSSTLRRTWWLLRWGLIGSFRQYFGSIYISIILGSPISTKLYHKQNHILLWGCLLCLQLNGNISFFNPPCYAKEWLHLSAYYKAKRLCHLCHCEISDLASPACLLQKPRHNAFDEFLAHSVKPGIKSALPEALMLVEYFWNMWYAINTQTFPLWGLPYAPPSSQH